MLRPLRLLTLTAAFAAASAAILHAEESPAAKAAQLLSMPEVQAAISACQADREKFCTEIKPGGGRIVKCLMQKSSELDPRCSSALLKAAAVVQP
jgi:hypothetical protein